MSESSIELVETQTAELAEIQTLMLTENDQRVSLEYLDWWYFRNPSESFSFWHSLFEGKTVGMATTNNFRFQTPDGLKLVPMPQKVLTAASMRGKGLFGKLYRQTEQDNLDKGADFFLTFTNAASTPIFLGKFGYARGRCPDIIFIPPKATSFLSKKDYEEITSLSPEADAIQTELQNSVSKNAAYFRWRYFDAPEEETALRVFRQDGEIIGYVFLKKIHKKRVPLYVLLDAVCVRSGEECSLLDAARNFATRHLAAGLLAFDNLMFDDCWRKHLHRRVKNNFNFLVKGKTDDETKRLAETEFNFFFGDLDFI